MSPDDDGSCVDYAEAGMGEGDVIAAVAETAGHQCFALLVPDRLNKPGRVPRYSVEVYSVQSTDLRSLLHAVIGRPGALRSLGRSIRTTLPVLALQLTALLSGMVVIDAVLPEQGIARWSGLLLTSVLMLLAIKHLADLAVHGPLGPWMIGCSAHRLRSRLIHAQPKASPMEAPLPDHMSTLVDALVRACTEALGNLPGEPGQAADEKE